MTVLIILGSILVAFLIYILIQKMNAYTKRVYNYKFFEWKSYLTTSFSYALICSGIYFYDKASVTNGDLLNGQILFVLGVAGLLLLFFYNIHHTDVNISIVGTIFQLIVYSVLALVGILILFAVIGYAFRYYDNRY